MGDRRSEPGAQLLVGGKVAFPREVHESLSPTVGFVRNDEGEDAGRSGEELRRQPVAFANSVDALARAPAREQHALVVVEDDDRFAALLHERARPYGVRVHPGGF